MTIKETETLRANIQNSFELLIKKIGTIQIGLPSQFPYGWRKSAKGRTVWRIVEEIVTQNLQKYHSDFNLDKAEPSPSEVSVYDIKCTSNKQDAYVNIKSALANTRNSKDDISKANGLIDFYNQDKEKQFFVATFYIKFNSNMTIETEKCVVFPVAWIPDIYINPSNNGNLQSSKYKDLLLAQKRTNDAFIKELLKAKAIADKKKAKKKAKVTTKKSTKK